MSKITLNNRSLSHSITSDNQQSIRKRLDSEESHTLSKKKMKSSIDVTLHWKNIYAIYETNTIQIFKCKSKIIVR